MTRPSPCVDCVSLARCPCPQYVRWLPVEAEEEPPICLVCVDVAWLLDAGEHPENVAARLGLAPRSLAIHLRRHGRLDLRERTLVRAS